VKGILVRGTPATVELREITRENVWHVCRLRVADDQRAFVADNLESIAEAYVEPSFRPFAIYATEVPQLQEPAGAGDGLVGFTMYGREDEPGRWWVIRLMVAEQYQGRGYGRAAMQQLIGLMRERESCEAIVTSVVPGNLAAARLYESLGFRGTGEIDEGEIVLQLDLSRDAARP
jgi:diamine N-acetyltransferase